METIALRAPAKINLYLYVMGKRPDGYHQIESLIQAVDLCDEITLERSDTIELVCSDPSLPAGEGNLAFRAAAALQARFYFPGVRIGLVKRIPAGAGLGGGSSDAASVLRGLIRLFGLRPSAEELTGIAAGLGSDVPFFLTRGQALVAGRGEQIRPVGLPLDYRVIIAMPPISISTADVYARVNLDLTSRGGYRLLSKKIDISKLMRSATKFHNDLEDIVLLLHPDLVVAKRSLLGTGAFLSAMTGSGSSFFGLYAGGTGSVDRLEDLKERGYSVYACKPILLPPALS